jgi:hypothetical protein
MIVPSGQLTVVQDELPWRRPHLEPASICVGVHSRDLDDIPDTPPRSLKVAALQKDRSSEEIASLFETETGGGTPWPSRRNHLTRLPPTILKLHAVGQGGGVRTRNKPCKRPDQHACTH